MQGRQDAMIEPLSARLYFHRNKARVLPVLGVVVLAVLAASMTAVLTGSMIHSARQAWLGPYRFYSVVTAPRPPLPLELMARLTFSRHVGRLVAAQSASIRVRGIFGSEGRPVLGLAEGDARWFLRQTESRLVAGRLPRPGRREIALHRDILKGKGGLGLGGQVGQEVKEEEWLPGRYRVVGVLEGPLPLGITVLASPRRQGMGPPAPSATAAGPRTYLVFPRAGQRAALEADLLGAPRGPATVLTFGREDVRFRREIANVDALLWALNLLTVVSISLAVGLLNIVFFMQRMGEFGILAAMGFRRSFLVWRTAREVLVAVVVGWGGGLLLAQGVDLALSHWIYEPRGIHLTGVDGRAVLFTLPIPFMILLFSLALVAWRLARLDPVTLVERRD